jgi:hypothetical protein
MADICLHVHARAPDAESTTIVIAVGTEKTLEVFELEAEVLLTASDQSHKEEMAATTVMVAIGTMTAIVSTRAMTATDAATEAEIVDVLTVDTKFMRNTITFWRLDLTVMTHLWLSVGRRL